MQFNATCNEFWNHISLYNILNYDCCNSFYLRLEHNMVETKLLSQVLCERRSKYHVSYKLSRYISCYYPTMIHNFIKNECSRTPIAFWKRYLKGITVFIGWNGSGNTIFWCFIPCQSKIPQMRPPAHLGELVESCLQ